MQTRSYPLRPESIPPVVDLRSGHYAANFARNESELEEVLRLRFEVFNLEMGEGLDSSFVTRMDRDPYDCQCHHLIIRDTRDGSLVGTYRMQSKSMADTGQGFYSKDEFELSGFPEEMLDEALELGRACIANAHRSGRVLFLLWRGLFAYLRHNNLRFMFGCCSLTSQDPGEGWALYHRLERAGNMGGPYRIKARPEFACDPVDVPEELIAGTVMPRLMSLYIDYGATMCSYPAIDRAFKTIDFLCLFDMRALPPKLLKIFSQDVG